MPTLVTDRCPDADELSQAGTVDVIDTRNIQYEVALALAEQVIHRIAEWKIQNPESSGQIENHHVRYIALLDHQRHKEPDSTTGVNYALSPAGNFSRLCIDAHNFAVLN